MKKGHLSEYFESVSAKRLSSVEVDIKVSNQHEFNGSSSLQRTLGTNDSGEKVYFDANFIWLGDNKDPVMATGRLSWYDARFRDKSRRPEWRLYFPKTDVSDLAKEGDLLLVAKATSNRVFCIISEAGSTIENQLLWLFHVPVQSKRGFTYQEIIAGSDKEIIFPIAGILENLGIEIQDEADSYLNVLLENFQGKLPTTKEFSSFTRSTLKEVNAIEDPDQALMTWMNHEERLFRLMEHHYVQQRLKEGFVSNNEVDVDSFISFSLSVHNTRKSRAGLALENHLEEIFKIHGIKYDRGKITENKNKPDFIFPGIVEYHNSLFQAHKLFMLAVKTTCKDRWRQVLSEAVRIPNKHLLTLEPAISENQTNEMKTHNLQLVLPLSLHTTYLERQQSSLMCLKEFIEYIAYEQKASG